MTFEVRNTPVILNLITSANKNYQGLLVSVEHKGLNTRVKAFLHWPIYLWFLSRSNVANSVFLQTKISKRYFYLFEI